jgi:hypothetical protein
LPRRLLSLGVLVGIGLLAARLLGSGNREVDVRYRFGDAADRVRALRVDYLQGDESMGYLERNYPGGAERDSGHRVRLGRDANRLAIAITSTRGAARVERVIDGNDDDTVVIDLEADVP